MNENDTEVKKERKNDIRENRLEIGAEILLSMSVSKPKELPLPTFERVAIAMMKHFREDGYIEQFAELKLSISFASAGYWNRNKKDLVITLLKKGHVFGHSSEWQPPNKKKKIPGFWRHEWNFQNTEKFQTARNQERKSVETRTDSYNEKVEEAPLAFKDELPTLRIAAIGSN